MPEISLTSYLFQQHLENGFSVCEPLMWDHPLRLHNSSSTSPVEQSLKAELKNLPAGTIYRYRMAAPPDTDTIELDIKPPQRDAAWRTPLTLCFPYAHWQHGNETTLVYIPALQLTVLADKASPLNEQLEPQIRFALMRRQALTSLEPLVHLQRCRSWDIHTVKTVVRIPSLKQVAIRAEERSNESKSILKEVADNLVTTSAPEAFELDEQVEQLATRLAGGRRSVLLVGSSGVGKTTLVRELVRRREQHGFAHTPFWSTSGSRLVAGQSGYGMWQQQCQKLIEEASRQRAILHLGSLVELIEVGKGGGSQQGMASLLRHAMQRGELVAIAECTPAQLALIEQEDPQLLDTLHRLDLEEPDQQRGRTILLNAALAATAPDSDRSIGFEAIEAIDRLHRRYATYSAYPGRPLRFLNNLLSGTSSGPSSGTSSGTSSAPITAADVTRYFSQETGLPQFLLDDATPLDLEQVRGWLAERVMGQSEAVQAVTDTIGAVKAGLVPAGRPIASFLFIGPTGVGKTQMAKSLSEFMYGDPHRMVRIDMSEYADRQSVDRLIGGSFATSGILTAKVREQPFTVVLLDEFEKADPSFFDLLLQVLSEGRLTDSSGRLADFRNSIIIMTSNLGADTFKGTAFGFSPSPEQGSDNVSLADDHFLAKVREFVRPEFFNRLDRVIPFHPLPLPVTQQIAKRELDQVLARDGIRFRPVAVDVPADACEYLAEQGYDPRYGARPLKRAIQRHLVAPLAEKLNRYSAAVRLSADVQLEAEPDRLKVEVRSEDTDGLSLASQRNLLRGEVADRVTSTRRRSECLFSCAPAKALRNEIYRLQQALKRLKKRRGTLPPAIFHTRQAELHQLAEVEEELEAIRQQALRLERDTLIEIYQDAELPDVDEPLAELEGRLEEAATNLYLRDTEQADHISLIIFGQDAERRHWLCDAYAQCARARDFQVERFLITPARDNVEKVSFGLTVDREEGSRRILDVYREHVLPAVPPSDLDGAVADALSIRGKGAFPLFSPERGIHHFVDIDEKGLCVVDMTGKRLFDYIPPQRVDRAVFFSKDVRHLFQPRRTYDVGQGTVHDLLLRSVVPLPRTEFQRTLESLLLQHSRARIARLTESWT